MSVVVKRLDGSRIKIPLGTEIGLGLGMRGIPVSEKYCGIKSDGRIIYGGLAKYGGIPFGGIDFQ